MLSFSLPLAPSTNSAFANRKGGRGFGRVKSGRYRAWVKQADAFYLYQRLGQEKPVVGPYTCKMIFPSRMRGDLDNRSKLILDWMVRRGLTPDDKHLRGLVLERDDKSHAGHVWVAIEEFKDGPGSLVAGTASQAE